MQKEVIIEEEVKVVDYATYDDPLTIFNDTDHISNHYNVLDVIDRLIESYDYRRQQAIIFAEKHRKEIIELMTLNGLNPFDTIDTIKYRQS